MDGLETPDACVSVETLASYAAAWDRHDIEAIMALMTPDCVFESGGGGEAYGSRHVGAADVRARFVAVWTDIPDAAFTEASHFVSGDRGCSEWTFTGTLPSGDPIEVRGCDLFVFRDGLIAVKSTFLKQRK
jgi:ketosteroid isomerase-like protein